MQLRTGTFTEGLSESPSKPLTAGSTVQPAALTTHLWRSLVLVIENFAYEESSSSAGF